MLQNMPLEVLEIICRQLTLKDRISLSIACRSFLHSLASSEAAWGTLEFNDWRAARHMPVILPWLAHRRQGVRRLELGFASASRGSESQAGTELAACLEGSSLVRFKLHCLKLSEKESGTLLQWMGSCTTLTSLSLMHCQLFCFPGALGLPPSLAELTLASNKLRRANWEGLRQLTTLTQLDIRDCGLDALPAELAALPALAALNLQRNFELGEAGGSAWAPLAQCTSLTSLNLGYMYLQWLPAPLAALAPHLVDLNLEGNAYEYLWTGGAFTLGPLCKLTGLTRLNLPECLVDNSYLPDALSCLVALQDLDLSGSGILGVGLTVHPLRHLTALTRLDLSVCCLGDLPEEISHLEALKELGFRGNMLNTEEGISWQHLGKLTALTRLSLEGCNLVQLPPELARLHSLAELNLTWNELLGAHGGWSAPKIAAVWAPLKQLTALTRLDAGGCNLHAMPTAFAALPRLRVLQLTYNTLLGRAGVEALHPLVRMTNLRHLDLSGCSLPKELEVDAIPFPLHRLNGWAKRIKGLSEQAIGRLEL